jgi:L-ascorbate metabolism protein UlaG (beta-lactamase superfamily)
MSHSQTTFEYKRNEQLPTIHPQYAGNKYRAGRYYNDEPRKHPTLADVWRWKTNGNRQAAEKKADKFRLPCIKGTDFLNPTVGNTLVWLGHSAFFVRINGISILIDPCLHSLPMVPRLVDAPCKVHDLTNIDYIILSHAHRDHCDLPSLRALHQVNPNVRVLAPLGVGKALRSIPFQEVQEAGWYQQFSVAEGLQILMLPAVHWNKRGAFDFCDMLWGSIYLAANGCQSIFFAGDTAFGKHFSQIASLLPSIDIALMPIGAYSPDFIMRSSHTTPEEAAEAFQILGAHTLIPCHYGTYDLSDEPISEPIRRLRTVFERTALRNNTLLELTVGQRCCIETNSKHLSI